MKPRHTFLVGLLLLAGALPVFPQDLACVQIAESRFVGTVQSIAPFADFSGTAIPLDFVLRRVVRVRVDRWLDEHPDLEVEDGTVALLVDDLHTYFPRRPYIGKTHLFTLTSYFKPGGMSYKMEVGPPPGR
jgi:hypothetical protein